MERSPRSDRTRARSADVAASPSACGGGRRTPDRRGTSTPRRRSATSSSPRSRPLKEVPFIGGNLNDATRVGDTVRRRAGPWTPAVHALLRFLENAGFEAPRARGMDDKGREILEYIDGDAHPGWPDPAPDWVTDDDHLAEGARLLRRYHDLVEGFMP